MDGVDRRDVPDPPVPELDQRLLSAPCYRFLARRALWSRPSRHCQIAEVGQWREYSRQELELLAGTFPFNLWLQEVLADEDLYAQAWVGDRWVPASWWQVDAGYLSHLGALAGARSDARRVAANMRTRRRQVEPPRPGLGEAAWHIVTHLECPRPEAIEIAGLAGFHVDPDTWTQQVNNGWKREKRGKPCRFC